MSKTCPKCGLPLDLCVCETIAKESQKIRVVTSKRQYGKMVTIIKGISKKEIDLKELASKLKAKLACGGTVKDDTIELQGDHLQNIREVLMKLGFNEEQIEV